MLTQFKNSRTPIPPQYPNDHIPGHQGVWAMNLMDVCHLI